MSQKIRTIRNGVSGGHSVDITNMMTRCAETILVRGVHVREQVGGIMKVKELIKRLQKYPEELMKLRRGKKE